MISLATLYLHNLAKRAVTNGRIYPAEVGNAPKLVDKVYGDGNGTLDLSDMDDIVTNVVDEVVDKAELVWDVITSIF